MMDKKTLVSLILALLALCLCVAPVSAVIQEVTLKGTVSVLDVKKNTITIENPSQYGCDYPAGGSPVCTFTPIDSAPVTGAVPTGAAFSVFKTGDTVIATSLGGTGGTWITLAKLYGPGADEEYVTDIVGDPARVPVPLVGDYALDISTAPDCSACYGTTCTAVSADVKVKSSGTVVDKKTLTPRQSLMFNGRNDGSSIAVTFVKGEAPSRGCASSVAGMTGAQPITLFVIEVVPPVGFVPAGAVAVSTPEAAQETVPVPTTHAASLPFAAIGALGMMALVLAARRR